jgi:hypothetical protein
MKVRPIEIKIMVPPAPATTTILALGFLTGNLLLLPMLAWLGKSVPADYREVVKDVVGLFKDGMLLILGSYFAKVVNAGRSEERNAGDQALQSLVDKLPPPTGEAAEEPKK